MDRWKNVEEPYHLCTVANFKIGRSFQRLNMPLFIIDIQPFHPHVLPDGMLYYYFNGIIEFVIIECYILRSPNHKCVNFSRWKLHA